MARIQHIAITANDPERSAEFYKRVFDMKEVRRTPEDGSEGVWLTDGYIPFAIRVPNGERGVLGTEGGVGIHHFGFAVEDLEETGKKLLAEEQGQHLGTRPDAPKFVGPDGVYMEMRGLTGYSREVEPIAMNA